VNFDVLVEKLITEAKERINTPSDEELLKAWNAHPSIGYLSRYYNAPFEFLKSKLKELGITEFENPRGPVRRDIKLPPLPAYKPTPIPPSDKGAPRSDLGVTDEELIELYKKLRTTTAVAKAIGKPQPTVYRRIKQLGQKIEGALGRSRGVLGGKSDEELLTMAKNLHPSDSLRNMAKRLGVPQPTLYNRLKKLGYISPLHKHVGTKIPNVPISDEDLKSLYNNTGGSVAEITRRLFPGKERMQYVVINKLKQLGLK
jgi:hypothetical protein